MSNEEKRAALIKKLQSELDDFVTINVSDEKQTQHELIKSAAPTIDNCIEIIFALSEYGDDLELTDSEYDKLLSSEHTLLALNDRFVSSDYHTTDSAEIIDFINNFVHKEEFAEITRYGEQNYTFLMEGIKNTKEESSDKLNLTDEFIKALQKNPYYKVIVENGELSVSMVFSGNRLLDRYPLSLLPTDTDPYNQLPPFNTPYLITNEAPAEIPIIFLAFNSVLRDVHNYNYGSEFPDLPRNASLREDKWHIIDKLGDYVLCFSPTTGKGAENIVQYAVWEYDDIRGGCLSGNYYYDYESAQRCLVERANVLPTSCVMALDFKELDTVVHSIVDTGVNSDLIGEMFEEYDKAKLAKIPQEWREEFYPITSDDVELMRLLPEEQFKNIYLLVGGTNNMYIKYPHQITGEEIIGTFGENAIYGIERKEGVTDFTSLKELLNIAQEQYEQQMLYDGYTDLFDDPNQGGGRH